MINPYEYIYYKYYKIAVFSEKNWARGLRIPQWLALFLISLMLFLNLALVLIIYINVAHKVPTLNKSHALLLMFALYFLNYLLFLRRERYKKTVERFDKESSNKKRVKTILFWLYVSLSIGLLIVFFSL